MLTLPMNMVNIKTSFEGRLKAEVIPVLKPTVLYAENASKAILSKVLSLSKDAIRNMAVPMTTSDSEIMAKALRMEFAETSLL